MIKQGISEESKEQMKLALLRNICLMQALGEALDELKSTPFYKQKVKNLSRSLESELSIYLNTFSTLFFDNDEDLMLNIGRGIDAVTKALATFHPAEYLVIEEAIRQLHQQWNDHMKTEENGVQETDQ
jgi:hypothetical protein